MLERRKAYIEFNSRDNCTITTAFRQKNFTLQDDDVIDLITLKRVKSLNSYLYPPCPFYMIASKVNDGREYLMAEVHAVTDPNGRASSWGTCDLYEDNKQVFEGTIWRR